MIGKTRDIPFVNSRSLQAEVAAVKSAIKMISICPFSANRINIYIVI